MMGENKGEHTIVEEKRSKGKSGRVEHDGKRSDRKCANEWEGTETAVEDQQTKVNGDKIEEKPRVQVGWRSARGQENTGVPVCEGSEA